MGRPQVGDCPKKAKEVEGKGGAQRAEPTNGSPAFAAHNFCVREVWSKLGTDRRSERRGEPFCEYGRLKVKLDIDEKKR